VSGLNIGSLVGSIERVAPTAENGAPMSTSFTTENDTILDRDWRARMQLDAPAIGTSFSSSTPTSTSTSNSAGSEFPSPTLANAGAYTSTSPVSTKAFVLDDADDYNPFEVRPPSQIQSLLSRARMSSDVSDGRHPALWVGPTVYPAITVALGATTEQSEDQSQQYLQQQQQQQRQRSRRWWPSSGTAGHPGTNNTSTSTNKDNRRGLNPDAKVFRFGRKHTSMPEASLPFDSLNPSGAVFASGPPMTSASSILSGVPAPRGGVVGGLLSGLALRAFAPSPAEREALQRALGGASSNTSLERLPSLSEVASVAQEPLGGVGAHNAGAGVFEQPSRITFSPWSEDGEIGNGGA